MGHFVLIVRFVRARLQRPADCDTMHYMDTHGFIEITPDMKAWVDGFVKPWKLKSSEHTFTNLLIWGADGHIRLKEKDDTLFILLEYGIDGVEPFMFAPLTRDPAGDYCSAMAEAVELCGELGIQPVFKATCGQIYDILKNCGGWQLTEDRGNFDYVYSMEELLTLSGKKLHAKRNHINQFRANNEFEYVKLDGSMKDECMAVYDRWLEGRDIFDPVERKAIALLMDNMDRLGVVGGGIRIGGRLKAFTLGEVVDDDMAVVHIEKAEDIPGLYTVINQQFVEHELTGVKLINREEDMGLEGLRRAKLSYNPVMMIEKYEARPL